MKLERKKSRAEVKREIIDFLNAASASPDKKQGKHRCGMIHRNALVLATSHNDSPRATVLEFFNEGLTIYIFGEPGGKIANIRRNPKVSAVIYEQPMNHARLQKSLQIFGKAELITIRNHPRIFRKKVREWNLYKIGEKILGPLIKEKNLSGKAIEQMLEKTVTSLNLIRVTPHHIILKEWHPDFSIKKFEWRKTVE